MQAIVTKYHGPTDARGSRISARCVGGRIFVSYDHALDSEENHEAAARALARKLEWSGVLVAATLPDGSMAHVFVPTR